MLKLTEISQNNMKIFREFQRNYIINLVEVN